MIDATTPCGKHNREPSSFHQLLLRLTPRRTARSQKASDSPFSRPNRNWVTASRQQQRWQPAGPALGHLGTRSPASRGIT
ncbi:hypothetical protein SKAU_G00381120 [Synaphobranchus kaupii]|uniref:Uncharacterized protein n=1 Tax=Synaphobranchus kaupii TaxID=118154 RepID=A0A9Q1EDN5_SYNKA|nr:hypothetical protein SKAU_G00381120 [Synaphobranchus kaupii]